jgi:hypothetical protein
MLETLKASESWFLGENGKGLQGFLRNITVPFPPTVYPAAAGGMMGLLMRPRAADVIKFYQNIERLSFFATRITSEPTERVLPPHYPVLIEMIEEVCKSSLPLLSKSPFDERDAGFRAKIAKWGAAEAGAATIKTGISQTAADALVACRTGWRCALTARRLNTIGLVLGIVGVLIIFEWGPPQPSFDEGVAIGIEPSNVLENGQTVAERDADVRRLKRQYEIMSRVGLGLIGLGFAAQLAAVRRTPR